uniref:Uncharacterized protein n=1 Tax=Oryza brachyantha TaxID=4533 RepID=J3N7V2_ORYBR
MLWFVLNAGNAMMVRVVASKCQFEESWGTKSVDFAASLLDSDSEEDYMTGARMLVSFLEKQKLPVKLLIRSSRMRTQKLITTLGWTDPTDREMRELAATIVGHLAGDISLAQFPGALQSITSLIDPSDDPSFYDLADQHDHANGRGRCQLILHGLLIAERLTRDNDYCVLMCKDYSLLVAMCTPMSWTEMSNQGLCSMFPDLLRGSLRALASMMSNTTKIAPDKLDYIFERFPLMAITAQETCPGIQVAAIGLYTQLVYILDGQLPEDQPFTEIMVPLFLSCGGMKQGEEINTAEAKVKVMAGEALARLSSEKSHKRVRDDGTMNADQTFDGLTGLLVVPNRTVREIAAEIMENVYCCRLTRRLRITEKIQVDASREIQGEVDGLVRRLDTGVTLTDQKQNIMFCRIQKKITTVEPHRGGDSHAGRWVLVASKRYFYSGRRHVHEVSVDPMDVHTRGWEDTEGGSSSGCSGAGWTAHPTGGTTSTPAWQDTAGGSSSGQASGDFDDFEADQDVIDTSQLSETLLPT